MSIEQLRKDGWFGPLKEADLPPISYKDVKRIIAGENIFVQKGTKRFHIYLRDGFDVANIKEKDLVIVPWPYPIPMQKPLTAMQELKNPAPQPTPREETEG